MASMLAFPSALLPALSASFNPDPEVHRLRRELEILRDKIRTETLIDRFDLEAKRHSMEIAYEAAIESAGPVNSFSPEYLRQADIDNGFCPHCHQSL